MLNRQSLKFSEIANEVLETINGRSIINNGINIKEVGKERFLNLLYEKQAELIKKLEN